MAARKFDMAAAVANNLVEVDPENSRLVDQSGLVPASRCDGIEKGRSDLKVSYPVAIEG